MWWGKVPIQTTHMSKQRVSTSFFSDVSVGEPTSCNVISIVWPLFPSVPYPIPPFAQAMRDLILRVPYVLVGTTVLKKNND